MDLLSGMEFDLFVPSFPEMQTQFGLTTSWVEALLSINFVGYCIGMLYVGSLSDRYGRKPIITAGLSLFIIGSILCLWPVSYYSLLIGRFLQGLGIAAPNILSFLIVADAYTLKEQQFYMGILNGVMNAGVGLAPVLGSYVTLYFHWQGNFAVLFILSIFTLLCTLLFIPKDQKTNAHESISLKSYLPLLRSKPQMLLIIHLVFLFIPYWIFVGMSPMLYMKDLGVSLAHFGFYQGSLALVFALGSILFSLFLNKFKERSLFKTTKYLYCFSFLCILSASLINTPNPLFITLALITFVISQIIPTGILYPICINFSPQAKGRASGLVQALRLILCALGLQLAGYMYNHSFQNIGIIISVFILLVIISYRQVLSELKSTS
jgi:DHA1 family bicyclomycin/chloramphenicol resistance-like MFS transporter